MPDTTTTTPVPLTGPTTVAAVAGTLIPVAGPAQVGYGWACPGCDLTTGGLAGADEAAQLAAVHDQLHHGGAVTAVLIGGAAGTQAVCESCRRAPATVVWDYPPAGAPFALCSTCAPAPASTQAAVPAPRAPRVGGER